MAQNKETERQESLQEKRIGTDEWWSEIKTQGTPIVSINGGLESSQNASVSLEFYWRDPEGSEKTSSTEKVYIDIANVTNHHTFSPDALERIAGTDVWYWHTSIENDWRGSYSFIPVNKDQLPPHKNEHSERNKSNLRQWWRSLQSYAIADPLNSSAPLNNPWSERYSSIHLNNSPYQYAWHQSDTQKANHFSSNELNEFLWSSQKLNNQRKIWIFEPQPRIVSAEKTAPRTLIIMLDGEFWAKVMPIFNTLKMEVMQQRLPAATFVLVDSINPKVRSEELTCNRDFWQAIQDELMPQIKENSLYPLDLNNIILAGQSFGGLSALYAGIEWPQVFQRIISQSGSFWWPHIELMKAPNSSTQQDYLSQQIQKSQKTQPIEIYQEVGKKEKALKPLNERIYNELKNAEHKVTFHQYNGGHDRLCWRGGLINGLHHFLKHKLNHTVSKEKVTNDGKRLYQSI